VDLASDNVRDLTPFQGVKAQATAVDPNFPDTILVALNLRNRALFDVYRLDLNTGALVLDTVNPGDVMGWVADPQLQVRAAQATTPEGGVVIRIRGAEALQHSPVIIPGTERGHARGVQSWSPECHRPDRQPASEGERAALGRSSVNGSAGHRTK